MPEIIEIEMYRRPLHALVGERLERVDVPDVDYVRPAGAEGTLTSIRDTTLVAVRRIGKLLLLDHEGPDLTGTLGLRFGMTGRLLVDETSPIEKLEYSSGRNDPAWDRVILHYGGRAVAVRDPRRLGSIELEPDESALGADAWNLAETQLTSAMAGRRAPLKAFLLNQKAIAGLGNLLADEILWRVGLAPTRTVDTLSSAEQAALAATIAPTVQQLDSRGGSHTGDSFALRAADTPCSKDGALMRHDTIGGRSTWWCPAHQT
jgi:formamidopyrimidine-DNA glycosylase